MYLPPFPLFIWKYLLHLLPYFLLYTSFLLYRLSLPLSFSHLKILYNLPLSLSHYIYKNVLQNFFNTHKNINLKHFILLTKNILTLMPILFRLFIVFYLIQTKQWQKKSLILCFIAKPKTYDNIWFLSCGSLFFMILWMILFLLNVLTSSPSPFYIFNLFYIIWFSFLKIHTHYFYIQHGFLMIGFANLYSRYVKIKDNLK